MIVDHRVPDHLHTTHNGNPTEETVDGMLVHSIFKRLKNSQKLSRDRGQKKVGDNCPLVYALKGKHELETSIGSIKALLDDFPLILDEICQKLASDFDAVVPMPSSFPLARCLATRIGRHTSSTVLDGMFRKSTNQEAAAAIEARFQANPKSFPRDDAKQLRNSLKRTRKTPNDSFSAKNVGIGIRQHFEPLQPECLPANRACRLLLVDDLLATGETLLCARRHLVANGFQQPIHAVTWFSSV